MLFLHVGCASKIVLCCCCVAGTKMQARPDSKAANNVMGPTLTTSSWPSNLLPNPCHVSNNHWFQDRIVTTPCPFHFVFYSYPYGLVYCLPCSLLRRSKHKVVQVLVLKHIALNKSANNVSKTTTPALLGCKVVGLGCTCGKMAQHNKHNHGKWKSKDTTWPWAGKACLVFKVVLIAIV